ncbi:MAG: hypothetical protein ACK4NS_06005 [Saprospiraceae bacterium]
MDKMKILWLRIGVTNLLIVALLGFVMRYKIGFEFPWFHQKHLQHAHAHFAFGGWVTHTLFVLLGSFLQKNILHWQGRKYNWLIGANLACSYGMLGAFMWQGYGAVSIAFSTLFIFVGYAFARTFWRDARRVAADHPATRWFRAALAFMVLSSLGTFALAYMMATKQVPQKIYLASVYFYLHFQYNGWFLFALAGLLTSRLYELGSDLTPTLRTYRLFVWSCVPTYFLSALWLDLPWWLYAVTVVGALMQSAGAWTLVWPMFVGRKVLCKLIPRVSQWLFLASIVALVVKIALQLGSVIPAVSQLAFGFRTVVIAYLHLVLLLFVSLFLLAYAYSFHYIRNRPWTAYGLYLFAAGAALNELTLGAQGIASFRYVLIPYANHLLVLASGIMAFGLALLMWANRGARLDAGLIRRRQSAAQAIRP